MSAPRRARKVQVQRFERVVKTFLLPVTKWKWKMEEQRRAGRHLTSSDYLTSVDHAELGLSALLGAGARWGWGQCRPPFASLLLLLSLLLAS
eukprot:scaffold3146_cov98-Isochrysis_galbana.AAC.4